MRGALIFAILTTSATLAWGQAPICSGTRRAYTEASLWAARTNARAYVGRDEPSAVVIIRGAIGVALRGCDPDGLELRLGVAVHGTVPDHTLGGGVGAELEVDFPIERPYQVGVRVSVGGGSAGFATAGLRVRARKLSLGLDGLYSAGVPGFYEDDPQDVTTEPVKGVALGVGGELPGRPKQWLIGSAVTGVVLVAAYFLALSQMGT